jgi:hypothetical protein
MNKETEEKAKVSMRKLKDHCDVVAYYIKSLKTEYVFDKNGGYYINRSLLQLEGVYAFIAEALEHTDE